jgi:CubicO group peptidase (beta-lactamase class C family)
VPGDFDLTTDELRIVARFVAETADELLPVFENANPDDPRPRAAVAAAWRFVHGAPRTKLQRVASLDAHRAAKTASTEASRLAARAAGDAASAAYLHPIAQAHQVGHILRAAANAARISEINAGSNAEAAAESLQRARQRATPALTDILLRYPPAPTGKSRVAQLMATLDTVLRTSAKIRGMPLIFRAMALLCALVLLTSCASAARQSESPAAPTESAKADAVMRIVSDVMKQSHLKAVIVRVTEDGREVVTKAVGESMTGVPATSGMHFRNGAVAISYVSTLLLKLVDQHEVSLDDKLSKWLPDVPNSDRVTLRQLAQMTSGYVDYVIGNTEFEKALYENPFRQWEPDQLLGYATSRPLLYEPGTNWNYAHTNYVLLGKALEKATGKDMPKMLEDEVLRPLGLTNTANSFTPEIPAPVLHAFTSERRAALKIPSGTPFYEESTYWNPSWTITHGAIQTTNIYDMEASAAGIGSGKLLSKESYDTMVSTDLRGKTHALPGCTTCGELNDVYTYGMGIVISGDWLLQNPLFAGEAGVEAYLPSKKIAIAIAVTYEPEAFDDQGNYSNAGDTLFRRIGTELAPDDAPPMPPK